MKDEVYSTGSWLVKAGQEDEFARRWEKFARWSKQAVGGAGDVYLVQEKDNPRHFISFGSWDSQETADKWRALPDFKKNIGRCLELCEEFTAGDYAGRVRLAK